MRCSSRVFLKSWNCSLSSNLCNFLLSELTLSTPSTLNVLPNSHIFPPLIFRPSTNWKWNVDITQSGSACHKSQIRRVRVADWPTLMTLLWVTTSFRFQLFEAPKVKRKIKRFFVWSNDYAWFWWSHFKAQAVGQSWTVWIFSGLPKGTQAKWKAIWSKRRAEWMRKNNVSRILRNHRSNDKGPQYSHKFQ